MLRRRFMRLFGLVPVPVIWGFGVSDLDGQRMYTPQNGDGREELLYLYARVRMGSKAFAAQEREQFVKALDHELKCVRADYLRVYDDPARWRPRVANTGSSDGSAT